MSAIDDRFQQLRAENRKAFIPFITGGDPTLAHTAQLLRIFDQCGAAVGEVGIPYSDPIADGPVIQASYTRALEAGVRLQQIFDTTAQVVPKIEMPVVSMVSYSIIHRLGQTHFLDSAQAAGFAGAIVPDLLIEEAAPLRQLCQERDFSLIHLVTPTTPPERMLRIAESSTGFIYFVSVTGITGVRNELPPELLDQVAWLKERVHTPICIGFGISKPEHVQRLAPVADGLIVGSAIVKLLAEDGEQGIERAEALVRELMAAFEDSGQLT